MKINTLYNNERVSRKEFKHASIFMLAHLVEENEHRKVKLLIESKEIKSKEKPRRAVLGKTFPSNKDKFKFRIVINPKFSRKKQLITLAHEIVHVKQFIRGELGETFKKNGIPYTRWKEEYVSETDDEYDEWPWEIEARGREYGLWRRYDNYIRKNKIRYD